MRSHRRDRKHSTLEGRAGDDHFGTAPKAIGIIAQDFDQYFTAHPVRFADVTYQNQISQSEVQLVRSWP